MSQAPQTSATTDVGEFITDLDGKAGEEVTRKTALHVGKFGALSLAPPNQMAFLDRQGQPTGG